ncbi:hypothetical protein BZ163_07675 [Pseudomonas sp. VI4.1]|nr:hypothetical protein BZ163_07675 [Pseudomonas sp. VI4.1]
MVCMILNKKNLCDYLYLVDSFNGSQEIAATVQLEKAFKKTILFKTRDDALRAAADENPKRVFIDSDVGLKLFINLLKLKIKSPKTEIHVYEEGIGTYRTDLIPNKLKNLVFTALGVGCYFGGASLTKKIHIFNPSLYKKNIPFLSKKIEKIEDDFSFWISSNKDSLIEVFSPGFKVENLESLDLARVYLSDWEMDVEFIAKLAKLGRVFVKPHPHIKRIALDEITTNNNIELVPGALPAELLMILLADKFQNVKIYHKNSSCMNYISSERIEGIAHNKNTSLS